MPETDDDLEAAFLQRFRAARKRADLTQEDIADGLGVTQQTVAKIEKGQQRLRLSEAGQLARLVGVPLERLLGLPGPSESTEGLLERLDFERKVYERLRGALDHSESEMKALDDQRTVLANEIAVMQRIAWFARGEGAMVRARIASLEDALAERGEALPEGALSHGEHQEEG